MRRLGIDIGGTKTLCVVVDGVGGDTRVVEERRVATDATGDAVAAVVGLARGFEDVASLGLGIAALVTRDGTAVTTTHLPGVRDVPLRAVLSEQLGLPVVVDNDGTCAAVAEWRLGAARGYDEVLAVTIGTTAGMMLVNAPAVLLGERALGLVPLVLVRRLAAAIFAGLGLWLLWQLLIR